MECEFCNEALSGPEPENVALIQHLNANQNCNEQYGFLLDNIRTSWTASCSGGA